MLETPTRSSDTATVAAWCRARRLPGEIVGRWVWLTFDSAPPARTREELRAAGFRWVAHRGRWAHSCGRPTGRGSCDPRSKYPVTRLEEAHA